MPNDSQRRSALLRLASGLSLYTLARSAAGAIRILTVPFIVHAVSANAFGTLATLWVPLLVVHGVCDLGLGTAAIRYAPEQPTAADRRSLFATLQSTRAIAAFLVSGVIVAAHEPLARWITGAHGNGRVLLWLSLTRPFVILFEGFIDELRARDAMPTVSGLVLASTIVVQALSLLFAVGFGMQLEGLVWARVVGDLIAFTAAAILCFRFVAGRPTMDNARRLLSFGWPLGVVFTLATLRGLDRPLIRWLTSTEHVAAYELAMRLVGPIGVFNIALAMVLEPFVYAHPESRDTPAFVDLFARCYVVALATAGMALSLVGPEMVAVFAPAPYREASRALPPLVFSTVCEGLQRAAGIGADLAKQTRVWALAGAATFMVGIGCVVWLVPRFGIAGAGAAWVLANAVATVLVYRVARGVSGIVLPIGRSLGVLTAGAAVATAACWQPWPAALRLATAVVFAVSVSVVMRARWRDVRTLLTDSVRA